jgi:hypothetical protein
MTMRYAHLAPAHLRTAVTRLEGLTRDTTEDRARARAQEVVSLKVVSRK